MTTGGGSIMANAPGFQPGDEGSTPIPPLQLRVEPVEFTHISPYIREHHYLRNNPSFRQQSFAVFNGWECVGAVVWGSQSGGHGADPAVWELKRFWLREDCGRNSESRVLGYVIRWIKKNRPDIERLISYSDESMGHQGIIYKASGWVNDARLPPSAPWHGKAPTKVNGWKIRWVYYLKKQDSIFDD